MYEKQFSFNHKPFELVPNPEFLYLSKTHKKAITYLDYGIKEKLGFILLTGEIGSGKTTIIRNFVNNLNSRIQLSRINNTKVSSEQLISMINEDFGLKIEGKNKTRLLSDLNEFLIQQYSRKNQPVLLIDEAQNLSPDLLEEVRLLSNLETDKAKLLQIILVGQPELKKTLMLPELTQLRQRININYHIAPLSIEETASYIRHRLEIAGNRDAIRFEGDTVDVIYKFSRGIPRLVNILCDFALLTAFVEGKTEVGDEIVRAVSTDLQTNDYWSEYQGTPRAESGNNREGIDLSQVTGDMALRLIRLEELVENNLPELTSLANKLDRMEQALDKVADRGEDNKMSLLLKRVDELEQRLNITNESNKIPVTTGNEKRIDNQVSSIKKKLNDIDIKLRNL